MKLKDNLRLGRLLVAALESPDVELSRARDEWNILSSTPLLVFERAPVGFQTGDLRCGKDLVKRDERL